MGFISFLPGTYEKEIGSSFRFEPKLEISLKILKLENVLEGEKPLNLIENILMEVGLEKGYERLTNREKEVINLYYLEGYRDEEIANFYGIRRQIINRLRIKGLTKLRKYINIFLITFC